MTLTKWPKLNRVPRCAVCGRKTRLSAYVERVAGGRVVALCLTHAPTARGAAT